VSGAVWVGFGVAGGSVTWVAGGSPLQALMVKNKMTAAVHTAEVTLLQPEGFFDLAIL
jgi:hypothetical protein